MRILIAFDGSECSLEAVRAAATLAREIPSSALRLLTVIDPHQADSTSVKGGPGQPPRSAAFGGVFGSVGGTTGSTEQPSGPKFAEDHTQAIERVRGETLAELQHVASAELRGLEVETEAAVGEQTAEVIAQRAHEDDAALIVVGTHGRSGLPHVLFGSVAEQVIRRARVPVLVVGPLGASELS